MKRRRSNSSQQNKAAVILVKINYILSMESNSSLIYFIEGNFEAQTRGKNTKVGNGVAAILDGGGNVP